jgi:OTU domain-containing protein 6
MGRKGGGRSGFMKAAHRGGDKDETPPLNSVAQDDNSTSSAKVLQKATDDPADPAVGEKRGDEARESTIQPPDDDEEVMNRDVVQNTNVETRGQMVQRHKREAKALKEKIKRMGKKAKDEAANLESEMEQRHIAELASLDAFESLNQTSHLTALPTAFYAMTVTSDGNGEGQLDDVASTEEQNGQRTLGNKKQSKAQRRREQRAREEAEREARIAAELAELGESEREAEEKELQLLLSPHGLGIKDIPPDGHCLYRSIEDQLEQHGIKSESSSFLSLRQLAADHLRQHADHFRHFVIDDEEEISKISIQDAANSPTENDSFDPFEVYCHKIEATAAWGGHVEIQALSQALKAHVRVYSVGLPVLDIGTEYSELGPTLQVCYLKHAYGLGEHYNSVRPIDVGQDNANGD